jgi:hypothetical protein
MSGIEDLKPEEVQALRLGSILLSKNPDIARKAKRLAKEADPTLRIPEIELEDQIAAGNKEQADRIAELEQRQIQTEVERRRERFRADCKEQGLDPTEVEKIVVDEKCSTSTAIKLALASQQTGEASAAEVASGSNGMHSPMEVRPDADWRKLGGNLAGLRRKSADVAHDMVNNFRKTLRRA